MNKRNFAQLIVLLALAAVLAACGGQAPAADGSLCGFLPPALLQQATGLVFTGPEVSDATTGGVEVDASAVCTLTADGGAKAVMTIFKDASVEQAQAAFDQFKGDFEVLAELPGVGDSAYLDKNGQLHMRKGVHRVFVELTLPGADAAALSGYANLVGQALSAALP